MPDNPDTLKAETQAVLDELWTEKLIPFELNVGKITKTSDHYIIHFHDSRMYTAQVPLTEGESWAVRVRAAVLARVSKLGGPLQ